MSYPREANAAYCRTQHVRQHGRVGRSCCKVGKEIWAVPVSDLEGGKIQKTYVLLLKYNINASFY